MTVTEYIDRTRNLFDAAGLFFGHGTDNACDEAVYLVYSYLHLEFDRDYSTLDQQLPDDAEQALDALVERRIEAREPVAYLVGEAWFCGYSFKSDRRALVPRSPIAELIANRFQPLLKRVPDNILDICTGGGCIGIACALVFPEALVDLADISEASLELASENIDRHGTSDRVRTIHSNLFAEIDRQYDLIVANPPYVSEQEMVELPDEFHHEPWHGLECADDGLALPLQILREAENHLRAGGMLIMEVGNNAEALQNRLSAVPLLWLEFEFGGHGVMAITASTLERFREQFREGGN